MELPSKLLEMISMAYLIRLWELKQNRSVYVLDTAYVVYTSRCVESAQRGKYSVFRVGSPIGNLCIREIKCAQLVCNSHIDIHTALL